MAHPIFMPRPGQMTEECTLVSWHKAEGDPVTKGDVLFEIETDKANMDVEAFDDGFLLRRLVNEGETVPVNTVVAFVGAAGESVPDAVAAPAVEPATEPTPGTTALDGPPPDGPPPDGGSVGEHGSADQRLRISPRASRMAAEHGLDPRTVAGTGPGGRIVERDVQAAIAAGPTSAWPARMTLTDGVPPKPSASDQGDEPARPLSRMRRVIAERMTLSTTTIPQFQVTVAVDARLLVELRDRLKAGGSALSLNDFVMAAATRSLRAMPIVNSWTDGQQMWPRNRVHLGLAVSVPDGLVVVVLRDAQQLAIDELHERAASMAAAARAGTLGPDDMRGSTFSISNLGMHGVEQFSAIINPGESAVLAVGSATPTPVAISGGIAVGWSMRLTLSADHRLLDGETAARFLDDVRRRLEDPESLLVAQSGY